jgi:hypothetical protein
MFLHLTPYPHKKLGLLKALKEFLAILLLKSIDIHHFHSIIDFIFRLIIQVSQGGLQDKILSEILVIY